MYMFMKAKILRTKTDSRPSHGQAEEEECIAVCPRLVTSENYSNRCTLAYQFFHLGSSYVHMAIIYFYF